VNSITVGSITPHGEPVPAPPTAPAPPVAPATKHVYTRKEMMEILHIGPVTLWRLEKRGRLRSIPDLGVKLYPHDELERFLKLPKP
jgi:hypothetical protein